MLLINAAMFVTEIVAGIAAGSVGLIADALDMLADALVYGLALVATTRGSGWHLTSARWSGRLQIALGCLALAESLRRFLMPIDPAGLTMVGVGTVALGANVLCLLLLARFRHGRIHIRAAWIFSTNDVLANLGVIASGVVVSVFATRLPDLIIGSVISVLVIRGGLRIRKQVADAGAAREPADPQAGPGTVREDRRHR